MKIDSLWHGRFWTGDPEHPEARTLAVHHGRIVAVDETDGLEAHSVHDFGDARVVPGLHDAHHHTSFTGARLAMVNLRYPAVRTLDELYEALRVAAQKLPEGAWLKATGYDQNKLGAHPTAEALDAVSAGHPALVEHVSGHMVVANTAAFDAAGYPGRAEFPDLPGGRVFRDENGLPEGLLQETAANPIRDAAGATTRDEVMHHLRLASEQAVSYGLTSLTEPGVLMGGGIGANVPAFDHYLHAVAEGIVQPRMTVMPFHVNLHALEHAPQGWRTLDLGVRTGLGDDRLRVGPVKIVSDGSLIGRSAAVHRCYCGEPRNFGVLQLEPDELREAVIAFHRAGWTVATHAIGDRAIDNVLDAVEAAQREVPRPVRHRIEHFAIATDEQVARAAELGVIPVPQGVFISEFGDGILESIGEQRSAGTYRMRSLLDAGITVPGSTDSPVSDANPFVSMHDLVNRKTSGGRDFAPHERVSVEEALRAYTHGSAYAIEREGHVGTLRPGLLADFVALSEDLLSIDPAGIQDVHATATVIGGQLVHDKT